jgi:3-dehydroquinate dehydratase-2
MSHSMDIGRRKRRWRIALLNGLNMTNLGRRDPHIYGTIDSLATLEDLVASTGARLGVQVVAFHSNDEGALVDFVEAHDDFDGYLINPGGLWAFGEPTRIALVQTGKPVVEVHFANIRATGERSTFTKSAAGTVMGFRHHGYLGGLVSLTLHLDATAA